MPTLTLLALGAVAAGALPACNKPDGAAKTDAVAEKAGAAKSPVKTSFAKVEAKKVAPHLDVSGTLDPDERSEVAAQTSGTVMSVSVDIGARVKKGDVLVELDAREASLRLDVANATTASQRARLGLDRSTKFDSESVADVRAAREARDLANAEHDRAKALFDSGAISKAQYDQAKSAKDRSDAAYDSARNGAEQAWAALLASQSQAGLSGKSLDDTRIRAPFDGSVVEKRISAGEFASVGRVVAVLVRDETLRFRFDVPEAQSSLVAIGVPVKLTVAAFPDKVFTGTVKRIGASLKVQTRTLPVEAEVANADLKLRPGFFAKAVVELAGEPTEAMFVPKAALAPLGSSHRVFVRQGDKVVERLVVAGAPDGDLVEVRGPIKPGDEVAVQNLAELSDGADLAP